MDDPSRTAAKHLIGSIEENCVDVPRDARSNQVTPLSFREQTLLKRIDDLERWQKSIGFEIHDGLTQQITAALLFLQEPDDQVDRQAIQRVRAILQQALAESRRLMEGLDPVELQEQGLELALKKALLYLSSISNANVIYHIDLNLLEISSWQRTTLFRFLHEAVTNALKHSQATTIQVVVSADHGSIQAVVSDDGIGFDASNLPGKLRLNSLEAKSELLQGKLTVDTNKNCGFKVSLCFCPMKSG